MKHREFPFPCHVKVVIVDGVVVLRGLLLCSTVVLHGGHGEKLCALVSRRQGRVHI